MNTCISSAVHRYINETSRFEYNSASLCKQVLLFFHCLLFSSVAASPHVYVFDVNIKMPLGLCEPRKTNERLYKKKPHVYSLLTYVGQYIPYVGIFDSTPKKLLSTASSAMNVALLPYNTVIVIFLLQKLTQKIPQNPTVGLL